MAFMHAMVSKSNVHGPATFMQSTGFVLPGFPSMGAWISYGLGSLTDDLPAFVVLPDPRGFAPNGPANWSSGFLPAANQGTMIRPGAQKSHLRPLSTGRRQRRQGRRRGRPGPSQPHEQGAPGDARGRQPTRRPHRLL